MGLTHVPPPVGYHGAALEDGCECEPAEAVVGGLRVMQHHAMPSPEPSAAAWKRAGGIGLNALERLAERDAANARHRPPRDGYHPESLQAGCACRPRLVASTDPGWAPVYFEHHATPEPKTRDEALDDFARTLVRELADLDARQSEERGRLG